MYKKHLTSIVLGPHGKVQSVIDFSLFLSERLSSIQKKQAPYSSTSGSGSTSGSNQSGNTGGNTGGNQGGNTGGGNSGSGDDGDMN